MQGTPPFIIEPPSLPKNNPAPLARLLAILLSLCLVLFLLDAVLSFIDDFLIVFFGAHILSILRGFLAMFALLMAIGLYVLIGLSPMVPKRLFLPIPIFFLVGTLAVAPLAIYWFHRIPQFSLVISLCQVIVAVMLLYRSRTGLEFWPFLPVSSLTGRPFSWRHLFVFALVNILIF